MCSDEFFIKHALPRSNRVRKGYDRGHDRFKLNPVYGYVRGVVLVSVLIIANQEVRGSNSVKGARAL